MSKSLCFQTRSAWTNTGWIDSAVIQVDSGGIITEISTKQPENSKPIRLNGWVIPGFKNAHSHAFQYGMAGHAECTSKDKPADDFWSWRTAMYDLALNLSPDQFEEITTRAYREMAKRGITSVAEFHYIHHDKDGRPYSNRAELAERVASSAGTAGIRVTIIPIFYEQSTFGKPALTEQRRFIHSDIESYLKLFDDVKALAAKYKHVSVGIGAHSLRGVKPNNVKKLYESSSKSIPFHMHAAEQPAEVEACMAHLKQRPVEWVLKNLEVDARCNLIHATHMSVEETAGLARSNATVVICPSTEANLGDGIFPLVNYMKAGGRFAVGTDSQIGLDLREELRWLEYSARLTSGKRNPLIGLNPARPEAESGEILLREAWARGTVSCGHSSRSAASIAKHENDSVHESSGFEVGTYFDGVVVDDKHPVFTNTPASKRLSVLVFAADLSVVSSTIVGGKIVHSNR